jgi:DNA-binding CsgD family transcriptional regulator
MLCDRDLWRLSDAIKLLHAQQGIDRLVWSAVDSIQGLIDCDWASVTLASPQLTLPTRIWSPCSKTQESLADTCTAFYDRHPNWRAFWGDLRPRATELLQLSTPRDTASLPIYHEIFKPLSIANLLAVAMPGSSMFAVSAIRDRARPYSARDGLVLEVLSDQLAAAARSLLATACPMEKSDLSGRVEFVALDPRGQIVHQSPGAGSSLNRFFPPSGVRGELPDAVQAWLATAPPEPVLCVATDGRKLELRRFDPRVRPGYCLVLYEEDGPASGWPLPPGLTRREVEIVRWVVAGKTNPEIGCILGISGRTVQKHLENVFAKLGVPTRTALVAEFLQGGHGQ